MYIYVYIYRVNPGFDGPVGVESPFSLLAFQSKWDNPSPYASYLWVEEPRKQIGYAQLHHSDDICASLHLVERCFFSVYEFFSWYPPVGVDSPFSTLAFHSVGLSGVSGGGG